jgi:radical SAM protein with 4Fe4S-binding SPASM domain
VRIATSLDGLGEANDAIRTTKTGKGTFDMILAKMDLLESIGYPLDGVSITVTAKNFDRVDEEIIDFATVRGMTSLALDYDLINFSSVPVDDCVAKILRLKNYAYSKGIYFGGTWYSPFRKIMTTSLLDRPHAFCAALEGRALVFNPDGSLKTCGYTTSQVGHISNLSPVLAEGSGLARLAAERFPATDPYCNGCIIEGPCGGQCQSTWEVTRRGATELFEEMCIFYRSVTDGLIQDYLSVLDDPKQLELRVRYL